jgi:putative component of toxin-antitoxin plasmid stabilization module
MEIKSIMAYSDELLTIPEFLWRKPKRGRPRKNKEEKILSAKDKWDEWDKIKQEKYGTRYDIQLGIEAPRIGSGYRIVYVKEGRKWAYMVCHSGDPSRREGKVRKRFSLKAWLGIKESHKKYVARQERALEKLRKKAHETNP